MRWTQRHSVYEGSLILVGGGNPLRDSVPPRLTRIGVGNQTAAMERRAAEMLSRLMERLDGWGAIVPVSGWRSEREQQEIYQNSFRENGAEFTRRFVALPGHSEHQTGLAIDLGVAKESVDFLRPDFPDTGVCGRFRRLAAAYGFVERYPADKEAITGIAHEPWHFRYVGRPHSLMMKERGLTLEEYLAFVRNFSARQPLCYRAGGVQWTVFYVAATQQRPMCKGEWADGRVWLSGDNEGGFVVTARKDERP